MVASIHHGFVRVSPADGFAVRTQIERRALRSGEYSDLGCQLPPGRNSSCTSAITA
jgi:hypothetical protein